MVAVNTAPYGNRLCGSRNLLYLLCCLFYLGRRVRRVRLYRLYLVEVLCLWIGCNVGMTGSYLVGTYPAGVTKGCPWASRYLYT